MSTVTQVHEGDVSLEMLQSIVLHAGLHSCFFNIRELTRHEWVSVGSDGHILRRGATPSFAPKWVIMPVDGAGHCKIYTVQNGECLAVGASGSIVRWCDTRGPEQLFRFVNFRASDRSCNIQENTRQEFISVDVEGNILRAPATGGEEQRFILEATDVFLPDPETLEQVIGGRKMSPSADAVPLHPAMATLSSSPTAPKEEYLIGVDVLPSVFVDDTSYTNKIGQVRQHPYYYLTRTRHWEKVSDRVFQHGPRTSHTAEVTHGCSSRDLRAIEKTIGAVVGAKLGGEPARETSKETGLSAKVGGELNFQFSWQRRELEEMERNNEEYHREAETVELVPTEECRLILWQLVDRYTLFDSTPRPVRESWTVYSGRTEWDCFPKQIAPVPRLRR